MQANHKTRRLALPGGNMNEQKFEIKLPNKVSVSRLEIRRLEGTTAIHGVMDGIRK